MSVRRFLLIAALFIGIIIIWFLTSREKELSDTFILYGKIDTITKSSNHSFGIIGFNVDSIANGRIDTIRNEYGKPYRVSKDYGEVYCPIPVDAELANKVKVDVPRKMVFLMIGDSVLFESNLYFQSDKLNLEFIRKNSYFGKESTIE